MRHILEETRPEAVYFTEQDGKRGAMLVVNVTDQTKLPAVTMPWLLTFNADVRHRIALTFEDIQKADIEDLTKKCS